MISKKNKKITLKNGKQYAIVDECVYNSEPYYFASEIENDSLTDNFKILKIYIENSKQKVKIVENDEVIKEICKVLEENYN